MKNKFVIPILIALLAWLNILTGIYFARNWTEEKQTLLIQYEGFFDNRTLADNFVTRLQKTYVYGTFDRIDRNIEFTPQQGNLKVNWPNGTTSYYHSWTDYPNNPITSTTEIMLSYTAIGINILEINNYGLVTLLLVVIDLGVVGAGWVAKHLEFLEVDKE